MTTECSNFFSLCLDILQEILFFCKPEDLHRHCKDVKSILITFLTKYTNYQKIRPKIELYSWAQHLKLASGDRVGRASQSDRAWPTLSWKPSSGFGVMAFSHATNQKSKLAILYTITGLVFGNRTVFGTSSLQAQFSTNCLQKKFWIIRRPYRIFLCIQIFLPSANGVQNVERCIFVEFSMPISLGHFIIQTEILLKKINDILRCTFCCV